MSWNAPPGQETEQFWREFLTRGQTSERRARRIFKRIPASPRCLMCAAPFAGVGGPLMRAIGKRQSEQTPKFCTSCFDFLASHHGGAEIECSFLFADVRGSTTLAENIGATQFRALLDRFYTTATQVVFDYDGGVDKFVGDELVAMFYLLLTAEWHAERAVAAAVALLNATGHADPSGPWVPLGAGVTTGSAWVGAVGEGSHTELPALGDTVNTAARLASAAHRGEALITVEAASAAGLDPHLQRRSLDLKGKTVATEVVSLSVGNGL